MIPIVSSNFSRYDDSTATQHKYPKLETAIGMSYASQNHMFYLQMAVSLTTALNMQQDARASNATAPMPELKLL